MPRRPPAVLKSKAKRSALFDAIRRAVGRKVACREIGIRESTLRKQCEADPAFARELEAVEEETFQAARFRKPMRPEDIPPEKTLKGVNAAASLLSVSHHLIGRYRQHEDWPGTRAPRPVEVKARDLLAFHIGYQASRQNNKRPSATADTPATNPEALAKLDKLIKAASAEAEDKPGGDLERDIATARKVARTLSTVVDNWDFTTMGDPTMARLFGTLSEALSKSLSRLSSLEASLTKIQRERGELLSLEQVAGLLGEFAADADKSIGALMSRCRDKVKDIEIRTYDESRIDSEELADEFSTLASEFKRGLAERVRRHG